MDRTQKLILILLALVLVAVIIAAVVLGGGKDGFTPPNFDSSAVLGEHGEVDGSLSYGTLTLTEGITVSLCGNPAVKDGQATVWLTSGADNKVWVRAEVYDADGTLLGSSGVIRAGEYVERIKLDSSPTASEGMIKVITYEPQTYYSRGIFSVRIGWQLN